MHQSGRNSGVIHAGYNPKPGSKKAEFCVAGNRELKTYCYDRGVPVREGGILIVARTESEIDTLNELERRGTANGIDVQILDSEDIKEVEPHAEGIAALQALDGASLDARAYVQALTSDATRNGTTFLYDRKVDSIVENSGKVVVRSNKGDISAEVAVNATGLHADLVAGGDIADDIRVVPFRGYYAELVPGKSDIINSHVYAAPDLNFPFLGVHLSKRTDGRVIVGPGAMLAFGREAYNLSSFKGGGLNRLLRWPGFYKMLSRPEFRSLIRSEVKKSLMVRSIGDEAMQLVPGLRHGDLIRSYAGNRAQLIDREGNLVDDIVVRESERSVHVLNAVSPGLTCSLPFGRELANRVIAKL
jgi:L-2-hydroxyglutarate oxidase